MCISFQSFQSTYLGTAVWCEETCAESSLYMQSDYPVTPVKALPRSQEEFTFVYQFRLAKTAVCAKDFKLLKWGPTLQHQSKLQNQTKTVAQYWINFKKHIHLQGFLCGVWWDVCFSRKMFQQKTNHLMTICWYFKKCKKKKIKWNSF